MVRSAVRIAAACAAIAASWAGVLSAQENVGLAYTWTKGDTTRYRMTMEKSTKVTGAQQMEAIQNRFFVWRQEVKDVAADGSATIEARYESAGVRIRVPSVNMDFSYDPGNPEDEKRANSPLAVPYVALAGEAIVFKVSKNGKVLEVSGFEPMTEKIAEKVTAAPKGAQQVDQAKGMLGELLTAQMEAAFRPLPEKPVKVGGTWPRKIRQPEPQLGSVLTEITYTLQGFEAVNGDEAAKISYAATKTVEPAAAGAAASAKLIEYKASGAFFVSKAGGRLVKNTSDSSTGLELTLPGAAGAEPAKLVQHDDVKVALETLPPAAEAPAARSAAPVPSSGS